MHAANMTNRAIWLIALLGYGSLPACGSSMSDKTRQHAPDVVLLRMTAFFDHSKINTETPLVICYEENYLNPLAAKALLVFHRYSGKMSVLRIHEGKYSVFDVVVNREMQSIIDSFLSYNLEKTEIGGSHPGDVRRHSLKILNAMGEETLLSFGSMRAIPDTDEYHKYIEGFYKLIALTLTP